MKTPLLFIILVSILVTSCSSSKVINTLKPEADFADPLIYDKELSYLNIPVSIKLKDLAYQTNSILNGLMYDDGILEDDNLMMKVWKQAPIEITDEKGKIKVVLPLKIWVKARYGANVMGMNLYDTRELNLNGIVTLLGEATFSNWQMKAKTSVQSIVWKESPSIVIAGKSVPITYLINPAMKYFKETIKSRV